MDQNRPKLTLCGGSCRNCPEVEIDRESRVVVLQEFGEKVALDEQQLRMLAGFARDNGFDV